MRIFIWGYSLMMTSIRGVFWGVGGMVGVKPLFLVILLQFAEFFEETVPKPPLKLQTL
jgi:hypothetical protein